ncbi:conserved hypothetical protein [Leishmania braziliensis MHOM/BR/75/M2904]|uniref:Uncharacterized protein n=2 Tax=Leishmania braziliensis TaxID=5660 RepID=A4HGV1_LEIBR|nr:conserved hypothetical protein [Leishmania braziliensis MHOM/BR/75/M2904]CAJ2476070.1 unnamed protein product [Leishmania braziliensis]CAM39799.1 conserved hypothetical protein [Leishmania braziliensis MHOM/BR/75/M2904]SYZ67456.1 hypothetical_protein [Leishmania braziliensis MHOM/BR/75/M2904]
MDLVQELIVGVDQADVEGGHRRAPASLLSSSPALEAFSAPTPAAPSAAAPPRRTKMVFVYSDEDDGDGGDGCEGHGATRSESGVAEVLCDDDAIAVSADALAELQAEAATMTAVVTAHPQTSLLDGQGDVNRISFEEDVVSGLIGGASAPFATAGGMRVREVAAPGLWEGAVAPAMSSGIDGSSPDEVPPLLRRGLPAAAFLLQSRRKRFRETPASGGDVAQPLPKSAVEATGAGESATMSAAGAAESSPHDSFPSELHVGHPQGGQHGSGSSIGDDSDSVEIEVEEEIDMYPVYEDDGMTVRALRTRGGYELTLDERDLLEDVAGGDEKDAAADGAASSPCSAPPSAAATVEEDEEADDDNNDEHDYGVPFVAKVDQTANSAAAAAAESEDVAADTDLPVEAEAEEWSHLDFDDEDEDEEEAALDEVVLVAVVEQLLQCCEADDLDPQMSAEAARFISAAKPLLEQLTKEVISPAEFVQRMDRDLRRFQRIYKSVYRPRDSPVVIEGVVTDL